MKNELNYIIPCEGCFYENENGLLSYRNREDFGRVSVIRMFPFRFEEKYLSVKIENFSRKDKNSEIGIIEDLSSFPQHEQEIIRKELERRYFMPEILNVKTVKEEFGHTLWNVETSAGEREFTVTDMGSNLLRPDGKRIILIDVYGNRYLIKDVSRLNDKALKIIEIWI